MKIKKIPSVSEKGFSLIEILIAIAVISILASVVLLSIDPGSLLAESRDDQREAHIYKIWQATERKLNTAEQWDCPAGEIPNNISQTGEPVFQEINSGSGNNGFDLFSCIYPNYLPEPCVDPQVGWFNDLGDYQTGYQIWQHPHSGKVYVKAEASETRELITSILPKLTTEIEIESCQELASIGQTSEYPLNANYILTQDIDISETEGEEEFQPIGSPEEPFTGSFNGRGYTIANIEINAPNDDHLGLFGYISQDGEVSNLILDSVSINGRDQVGGIAGENHGLVSEVRVTGQITGQNKIGGLVGRNENEIQNSYSGASVTGEDQVGGLIGINAGSIKNTYAKGEVTGSENTGGLIGSDQGLTLNSFWDTNLSGQATSAGGEGRTTAEMTNLDTFTTADWNIRSIFDWQEEIWLIDDTYDHPRLRYESPLLYFVEDLEKMKDDLTGRYFLGRDIDFNDPKHYRDPNNKTDYITGSGWEPIAGTESRFSGYFNGRGHKISNLYIDRPEVFFVGLFGHVGDDEDSTTIKNIHLRNSEVTGLGGVGSLIGKVTGNSETSIERVSTEAGSVTGTRGVGGLIGGLNSYRTSAGGVDNPVLNLGYAEIEVYLISHPETDQEKVGGLVGCAEKGTITNSFSLGVIYTEPEEVAQTGGLTGCFTLNGVGQNLYSATEVNASGSTVGGLVGELVGPGGNVGEVNDSFWDLDTSGQATSDGGVGLTTDGMQNIETYTDADWDITAVLPGQFDSDFLWNIENSQSYPFFYFLKPQSFDH